jgi:hypothetical protein
MIKLLSIFSIASIATMVLIAPAIAKPMVHYGDKGTYTVDNGTYRGCLYSGGCIFLGRKYLMKNKGPEDEGIAWKKGEYVYSMYEGYIDVYKNNKLIFHDNASLR